MDEKGADRLERWKVCQSSLTKKLLGGWSDKLWWVHSEAVYVTLLGYELTGKDGLKRLYDQVHAYTLIRSLIQTQRLGNGFRSEIGRASPWTKLSLCRLRIRFISREICFS